MAVLRPFPLLLRPMNRRDLRFYSRLYTDPLLMAQIGKPLTRRAARRSADATLAGMRARPAHVCCWIMQLQPSRVRIGLVGWRPWDDGLELGAIVLPPWQRNGFAVSALHCLCDIAMDRTGSGRLLLRHRPGHLAAAEVSRSLGFMPRDDAHDGQGNQVWVLTRDAWRANTSPHDEVS